MSRAIWKSAFSPKQLSPNAKVWSRAQRISGNLIGTYVFVHSGNRFVKIFITRERVGFTFGEFCYTKKHRKKVLKKEKKKNG